MHSQLSILLLLIATITSVANSQTFPEEASLPGCGETCLDAVVNEASTFGCSDGSAGCLCAAPNFQNGVRDCASAACAADLYPSVTNYLVSVCATAVAAGAATSVAPAAVSTPLPATSVSATSVPAALSPSSMLVPTTSSFVDATAPTSTTSPILPQSSASSPTAFTSSTTLSSFPSSTTLATNSTGAAGGALASASISQSPLSTGAIATTTPTSQSSSTASATSSPTSTPALSAGAKAGIGIGAAVGTVAAIAAIVACIITRKHKSRQQQPGLRSYEISEPMPGAGRVYANENNSQGFEPVSELEMKSRRYEDMMPRHVPRNMV